jgi:DNA primase
VAVGRIPEATVQEIRERVDLVEVVSRHVTLKQNGSNFKGLCPFHDEKTPSFNVNRARQIFHCFGCGEGGNVFGFVMKRENLSFPEAVRALARDCGIEIREDDEPHDTTRRLYEATEHAQRAYRRALLGPEGAAARDYLARRGLSSEDAERFGIGLAPDRWDTVAKALAAARIPADAGEGAGVLKARPGGGGHYDHLRGRVTFPIQDVRGRVIGFGGRALEAGQEPKYLNTPETAIFHKREALYGIPAALEPARRRDRLVVCEGYFDRIALARAGIEESVATCGTALTPEHARQLRRRAREVVLLFDGDAAGQRAIGSALEVLLPQGLRVRAAILPEGDDPDTFLEHEGAEALRALVDGAAPALERVIARATAKGVATAWEKSDAVAAVAPLLAKLTDAVERADLVRRLALAAGVAERAVETAVRAAGRGGDVEGAVADGLVAATRFRVGEDAPLARAARNLAQLLLVHPHLASRVNAEHLLEALATAPGLEAWCGLLAALLDEAALGESLHAAALLDRVPAGARALLQQLAVEEAPALGAAEAERAFEDTLAALERRRLRHESAQTTHAMRQNPDVSLLAAKQRELERRKAAQTTGRGSTAP